MENRILANRLNKFMLLLIGLVILNATSIISAQNRSTQTNVENTAWKATAPIHYTSYYSAATALYKFERQGKAEGFINYLDAPPPQTTYDPVLGWRTQYYNPTIQRSDEKGEYRQQGTSIHIEFPDYVIDATINGNRMDGQITDKKSNEKARWAAERILNEEQLNEYFGVPSKTITPMPNTESDSASSIKSPRNTAPLSMKERLPEQLGQFKRTNFMNYRLEDFDEDKGIDSIVPRFGVHSSRGGRVESVSADYSEGVIINVDRYKTTAECQSSLRKRVGSIESRYIVKREILMNRAKQQVGELVVAQGTLNDGSFYEVQFFTFGTYIYEIMARNRGDAQRIQKLLPLE
jgi:hypothetical protein